jgi:hypothetical protein
LGLRTGWERYEGERFDAGRVGIVAWRQRC